MIAAATVAISLFVTACLDGTLHGAPKTICREFQLDKRYPSVDACNKTHAADAAEWLNGIHVMGIDATLKAIRCAPSEKGDDDI